MTDDMGETEPPSFVWPDPPACPLCGAENDRCEHTRGAAYRQALVLGKLLDLAYHRGQSVTLAITGTHDTITEVYVGGHRVAIGDRWQEQVMALPLVETSGNEPPS